MRPTGLFHLGYLSQAKCPLALITEANINGRWSKDGFDTFQGFPWLIKLIIEAKTPRVRKDLSRHPAHSLDPLANIIVCACACVCPNMLYLSILLGVQRSRLEILLLPKILWKSCLWELSSEPVYKLQEKSDDFALKKSWFLLTQNNFRLGSGWQMKFVNKQIYPQRKKKNLK